MKVTKLTGKVIFKDIGMGAWGIVSDSGEEYRPVNMPEQLKTKGAQVEVTIKPAQEAASIHIWGTPVKIVSFQTLGL